MNAASAIEVEEPGAGFFHDHLEGREIPGRRARLDPDLGLARGHHHRVRRAPQIAHRPEARHPIRKLRFERHAFRPVELAIAQYRLFDGFLRRHMHARIVAIRPALTAGLVQTA